MYAFAAATGLSTQVRSHRNRSRCSIHPRMSVETASHTLDGRTITGPLKPSGQNILVRIAEAPETTAGGLILTSAAKEKPTHGEAIAVGVGKYMPSGVAVPMVVSTGDTVLYGKYGGTDVEYDGAKHTIVTQDDILCILKNGMYAADAVVPIYDRVLIKRDKAQEETESGIVLSGGAAEKPYSGKVIALGPGRFMENGETEPVEFNVGDSVMFGKYAGTEVSFKGEEHILMRMADIYAKW